MAATTPWAAATDKVLKAHKVSQDEGLSDDQVTALREKFGPNELDKEEGTPLWQLVLDQFDDLLVKILLGAACLSFALAFAEEGDDFAIVASDGVWDVLSPKEAVGIVQRCALSMSRDNHYGWEADAAARHLCEAARERWEVLAPNHIDDITCTIIKLENR